MASEKSQGQKDYDNFDLGGQEIRMNGHLHRNGIMCYKLALASLILRKLWVKLNTIVMVTLFLFMPPMVIMLLKNLFINQLKILKVEALDYKNYVQNIKKVSVYCLWKFSCTDLLAIIQITLHVNSITNLHFIPLLLQI